MPHKPARAVLDVQNSPAISVPKVLIEACLMNEGTEMFKMVEACVKLERGAAVATLMHKT